MNTLFEKEVAIASLYLKINVVSLTGEHKSQAQKLEEAQTFVQYLSQRLEVYRQTHDPTSSPKKKGSTSSTSVPFFDVEYERLLENLEGSKVAKPIALSDVESRLPILKDMFGLGAIKKSITELKNQSAQPLGTPV